MNKKPDENKSNSFDSYDMSYLDYYDSSDDYISNYNSAYNKDEVEYDYGYGDPKNRKNTTVSYSSQSFSKNDKDKATQIMNETTYKNIKKLKSKSNKTGKKKRKLKKDVKFKITAGVVLLILAIGVALYFNTDIFRTKREVFIKYFDQVFEATKMLEAESNSNYDEKKLTSSYKRVGNAKIISSSNVADSKVLDKLKFSIGERTDNANNKSAVMINVMNGTEIMEEVDLLRDGDNFGFYCKDIASSYIFVRNGEMKKIFNLAGLDSLTVLPDYIGNIDLRYLVETTDLEKDHINKLLEIMKNNVPNNAYNKDGKTKINIDGIDYDANAYSLTLNSKDSATLYIDVLEKITKDSILINYFSSKAKLIGMEEDYTDINKLNAHLQKVITGLRNDSSKAKELKVIVYENDRRNIRTEITFGETKIGIDHVKKDDNETLVFKINEHSFKISKNKLNTCTYEIKRDRTTKAEEFSLEIILTQSGTVEENNIQNKATINLKNGIKFITLEYNDTVNFTNEIGTILSIDNTSHITINDSDDKEIKEFINGLKKKINSVYVKNGTDIGINLDPIF